MKKYVIIAMMLFRCNLHRSLWEPSLYRPSLWLHPRLQTDLTAHERGHRTVDQMCVLCRGRGESPSSSSDSGSPTSLSEFGFRNVDRFLHLFLLLDELAAAAVFLQRGFLHGRLSRDHHPPHNLHPLFQHYNNWRPVYIQKIEALVLQLYCSKLTNVKL